MRSIVRVLDRLSDVIEAAGRFVLVLALVGLVVIVGLQVVDRHITDVPIVSPDAYARILLIWITFVGFALAGRSGMAIRVDLMDHWLPLRWQQGLRILFDALKIGVLVCSRSKAGFSSMSASTNRSSAPSFPPRFPMRGCGSPR